MHKFDPKHIEKLDNPTRRKYMPPFKTLEKFGLKLKGIGTFLDIGCGIGYFTIPAAKILSNGKAIGIDIQQEMLDHAKERAHDVENIEFKLSREYEIPINDCIVDYALLSNVLHEIEDKKRLIEEIKRVLKSNGKIFIIEWKKIDTNYGPPVEHRISDYYVIDLMKDLGLKLTEQIEVSPHHYGLIFAKNVVE
ncbi:Demethylmenaquinone methyltransferase [Caloramator mitchellensis]|uniref:Demethylmenaquinone methyltransferase n=1 Tax=Caloramator mitchellensis TaxID=908809 RepID=A0A0R3K4D0_CALMK|nr:class I SAM-dependent methyltransferase [Caloramator mitchellensis]KRQ87199.1 Demethylmenaquinone methyltransferase [Caloramator mitchellensis]